MADHRIVQCFGIRRHRGKKDRWCQKRFMWTAKAASRNFGSKGVQACPYCGTMPDFTHPFNRWLNGEMSADDANAAMAEMQKVE